MNRDRQMKGSRIFRHVTNRIEMQGRVEEIDWDRQRRRGLRHMINRFKKRDQPGSPNERGWPEEGWFRLCDEPESFHEQRVSEMSSTTIPK